MGCFISSVGCLIRKPIKMAEGGLRLFSCDICGQDGLTENEMRSHVLISHIEGAISCPFCDLAGTSLEEMNLHVNAQHLDFLSPTKAAYSMPVKPPLDEDMHKGGAFNSSSSGSLGNSSSSIGNSSNSSMADYGEDSPSPPYVNGNSFSPMEITITEVLDSPKKQNANRNNDNHEDEEQIRKRAKLYLNVPQVGSGHIKPNLCKNDNIGFTGNRSNSPSFHSNGSNLDQDNNSMYFCPLCDWNTQSPGEITRHVNMKHLDILSPANANRTDAENNVIDPDHPSSPFECPLCGVTMENGTALEIHVNTQHADLLSPCKSRVTTPVSPATSNGSPMNCCPVCGMEFGETASLMQHVEGHFSGGQTPVAEQAENGEVSDGLLAQELERRERAALKLKEQKEFEKLQDMYGMSGKGNYKKQAERNLERAVCSGELSVTDYYSRKTEIQQASVAGVDDGHSCTKGIIHKLVQFYKPSVYNVARALLCSTTDHYAASYGDKGWGCGYRNLQMMLSCVANDPTYERVLFNGRPLVPSIPKIQRLIEAAWQKGFDLQGCEQLGGKLVDTTKWIGATEIVATLSSLNIRCQLIDFHAPTGKDGTHPRLFEWVRDYFKKDVSFKPPLYLQHQGHSRTIIGVEELKDGSLRLLLFDPSCSRRQMQQFLGDINANLMRSLRRSPAGMKAKQYQIVAVKGVLEPHEYQESKVMKSDRIP